MEKTYYVSLLLALSANVLPGQTIDLGGTVSDLALKPVPGAVVTLAAAGLADTVDSQGEFSVSNTSTASRPGVRPNASQIRIHGDELCFPAHVSARDLTAEIYTLQGRRAAGILVPAVSDGEVRLSLDDAFDGMQAASMLVVVLRTGSATVRLRLMQTGTGRYMINYEHGWPAAWQAGGAESNSAGLTAIDTILVALNGTVRSRLPIGSYIQSGISIMLDILPDIFIDKLNEFRDYYQMDEAYGGFPGGGTVWCGPSSTSNALIWLAGNGYPDLRAYSGDEKKDQHDIISALGSPDYMNCTGGVAPAQLCSGLKRYVLDKGYGFDSLLCQGWRPVGDEFKSGGATVDLDWVKGGILRENVVVINVGWYTFDSATDTYSRNGGHWMTVVGYGHDGNEADPLCLVVHDPGTRTSLHDYRPFERITSGRVTGASGLPSIAAGMYRYPRQNGLFGILDAAVILDIKEQDGAHALGPAPGKSG